MAGIKLEFFVGDIDSATDFYTQALGFQIVRQEQDGYTALKKDDAQIDLQPADHVEDEHPAKPDGIKPIGVGVEVVLAVDDLQSEYDRVVDSGWKPAAPIQTRPWGASDFRVLDPDGRYIRVSTDHVLE